MVGTARWSVERVTSRDKRVTPFGVRVWSPDDGKLPDSGKAGKGSDKAAPIGSVLILCLYCEVCLAAKPRYLLCLSSLFLHPLPPPLHRECSSS